jgi:hypothetical protein
MKAVIYLSLFVTLAGCVKRTFELNDEFTLKFGKNAKVDIGNNEQVSIDYRELVEESRCAPNVQCVWAGRVAVKLRLDSGTDMILGINHNDYPNTAVYKNHVFTLVNVKYTSDDDFGKDDKSSVVLKVE